MKRLTSKRDWIEAGKDLSHEYGYSHIWRRLKQIEDILGDTYDLDRLRELCKTVRAVADECPTIDPESLRPHGRWVCVNPTYGRYECSVCHAADEDCSDYYAAHNVTAQDFCPYCGAKMDGGETDEAK